MADNACRVVMGADLGPCLGVVHDMPEDEPRLLMRDAGAVSRQHKALVMIALDPDRAVRRGDAGQRLPVGRGHA